MGESDWEVVRTDEHPVLDEKDMQIQRLKAALKGLLDKHTDLVNSGDCGYWDPFTEDEVIEALAALRQSND